jgi:putative Mn2+ efflux pump MntP
MSVVEIIILAIALSIDACVVSFCQGLVFDQNKRRNSLLLAFFVALFQGLMPVIGWYLASSFAGYLMAFDHWIAFVIFAILGVKFIYEAVQKEKGEFCPVSCISVQCLFMLAVATSIDALAAGVTLFFLEVSILLPALLIASITFINSLVGFWSGYYFKKLPVKWLEILAGLILIALGVKVLVEGLSG